MTTTTSTLAVIYECSDCGERSTDRRCPDCNLFSRRLGDGGNCPNCDEPVLVQELFNPTHQAPPHTEHLTGPAAELIAELDRIDRKTKVASTELSELVEATGSALLELHGIGPSGAARLLGDIGDVARFPTRGHFASWNGTAPIDAS